MRSPGGFEFTPRAALNLHPGIASRLRPPAPESPGRRRLPVLRFLSAVRGHTCSHWASLGLNSHSCRFFLPQT